MHFTMAIIVEHIWPMIFSYFVFSWVLYDPWLLLHFLHLLHLHEPYVCHGSYMPHDCSALSLSCVMGPIWSMIALTFVTLLHLHEPYICHGSYKPHDCTALCLSCIIGPIWSMSALHGAFHASWIIYDPWLLYTEPYIFMDPMWSMNALHGALHIPWILYDPWLLFTEPLLMLLSP